MSLSVQIRHAFPGFSMDVAFDAPQGLTVLFGRSGAGKTTVVNAVAGLFRPEQGRILLDGRVLTDSAARIMLPPHKRRVGYVFQDAQLFPHMTVAQNLRFGRYFATRDRREIDEANVVDTLGIGGLMDARPPRLSGGERQRVALARALLAVPQLLLMDEPLAGLDDERKAEVLPLIARVAAEFATPIVYVTHSVAEVAGLAARVIMLRNGRVEASGEPRALISGLRSGSRTGAPGASPYAATTLRTS